MKNFLNVSKKYLQLFLVLVVGFFGGIVGSRFLPNQQVQETTNSSGNTTSIKTSYSNTNSITEAVSKVQNAVVSVITYADASNTNSIFQNDSNTTDESVVASEGSGVIYKKDGKSAYVVTNNHVIAGGKSFDILLADGTKIAAELIGADTYSDLAVLKVSSDDISTVAEFGDSTKLQVGETAIAIGSPLGSEYANSVTQGIVSSLSRNVTLQTDDGQAISTNAIQTDAAINPGNSGGALINIEGQVIGINSSKITTNGGSVAVEGMGFAIPAHDVVTIINQLETKGVVTRPALGIQMLNISTISSSDLSQLKLPEEVKTGVLVRSTQSGMPADGKLKQYDVITKLDDTDIESTSDLQSALYKHAIGDEIKVTYYRDGKEGNTTIKLTKSTQDLN